MSKIRYIGSKSRIVSEILNIIGEPKSRLFIDVFAGTGIVSREASKIGWSIHANDYLHSATTLNIANFLSKEDVSFKHLGGYSKAVAILNSIEPIKGYFYQEYSPSIESRSGHERRYFTNDNAMKIDAIRVQIENWYDNNLISELEKSLLLADLIGAVNAVANTAGTYGCFLKNWDKSAEAAMILSTRNLPDKRVPFKVTNHDFRDLIHTPIKSVAYVDPPYSKRQYAAYYHILETLVLYDSPNVYGVTGLRYWQDKASPFCYKKYAPQAFEDLLNTINSNEMYISYSDEGQVAVEHLEEIFQKHGKTEVHKIGAIGRYRPNSKASQKRNEVNEYLFELRR